MVNKINSKSRLTAALPNRPNKPARQPWLKRTEQRIEQKPEDPNKLPEDTFKQGPSQIANILKSKSKDFQQAISRLSYYRNRSGDNLTSADKKRLDDAKEALYRAFGRELPKPDQT